MSSAAFYELFPDEGPKVRVGRANQQIEEHPCLGKSPGKTELSHGEVGETAGFEHRVADEANDNHVNEELAVKRLRGLAMPGGSTEGVLEVPIEGLDVPAHMI